MNRFSNEGLQLADLHISISEHEKEVFGDIKYTELDLEIKPMTVKAATYEIEALDHIASKLSSNRSNFVKDLFLTYMVNAVGDYVDAYNSRFAQQPPLPVAIRDFLELDKSNLSDASKALIESLIQELTNA